MLLIRTFTFCSEFYIVEKTIEVVVNLAGAWERIRIEALDHCNGEYSTSSYIEKHDKESSTWISYELPWVRERSADDALDRSLNWLRGKVDPA